MKLRSFIRIASVLGMGLGMGLAVSISGRTLAQAQSAPSSGAAKLDEGELRVQAAANALEATLEGALQAAAGQEAAKRRALLDYAAGLRELGRKNRGEAAERALVDSLMVYQLAGERAEVQRGVEEGIPRMSSWNTRIAMLEAVLEIPGTAALAEQLVRVLQPDSAKSVERAGRLSELAARSREKSKSELPPATPQATPPSAETMEGENSGPGAPAAPNGSETARKAKPNKKEGLDPFPFSGTTIDGKRIRLSDFEGKVVLIDFWATWCGPCIAELPEVQKIYEEFKSKGFEIIGVSLDKDARELKNYVRNNRMPWPQICDEKGWKADLAKAWGVNSIPATFLIDRNGRLVAKDLRGGNLRTAVQMFLER